MAPCFGVLSRWQHHPWLSPNFTRHSNKLGLTLMINFIGRILNGLNEFIYVAPLLFWDNELFKAFRKMVSTDHVVEATEDDVDETLEEAEAEVVKRGGGPISFGNDHASSLQKSHFNRSRISRVIDSYGITHSYDHRRKGFVLSIGKTMQFLTQELMEDSMSCGRVYAILDKLKHNAQMNDMSEELEKNAKESEILMRSVNGKVKHIGYIGAQHPGNPDYY